jgi:Fungal protein kinase
MRFRTTKILSSYGAKSLRGRGTRIFEVVEIDGNGDPNGSPVVLKDTWVDSDRTREGNILTSLRESTSGEDRELFEKYFLTTICHGDVWTEFNLLDDTANALMCGLNLSDHDSLFKLQRKPFIPNYEPPSGSAGLRATSRVQARHLHLRYAHKTHYRIIFKEKGITIDRMRSLPDVMTVLSETVSGEF